MQIIEDVEMKTLLGFPVVTKAEPYVPPPSRWTAPVDGSGLGSPVGSAGGQTSLLIAGLHTHTHAFYSSHISSESLKDTFLVSGTTVRTFYAYAYYCKAQDVYYLYT